MMLCRGRDTSTAVSSVSHVFNVSMFYVFNSLIFRYILNFQLALIPITIYSILKIVTELPKLTNLIWGFGSSCRELGCRVVELSSQPTLAATSRQLQRPTHTNNNKQQQHSDDVRSFVRSLLAFFLAGVAGTALHPREERVRTVSLAASKRRRWWFLLH